LAIAVIAVMAVFAQSAGATPTKSSACTNCHSGTNVPVTATLVSITSAAAVYNVSAPAATTIAVFNGATKLSYANATSTQITVAPGKAYTIYSVKGPKTSDGLGQVTVSPVAPVVDLIAPVTASNAAASYTGTAAITLTATDAGTGVAHTYYRLDGGAQVEAKSVSTSVLGTHTLEFWSVDTVGNVETPHKSASFTVVAAVDRSAPVTTSDALASYVGTATVVLAATDAGGSGVAHTYYRLDAGAQVESRTAVIRSVGAHTLEFWSVDAAGNTEAPRKTAMFTITAPAGNDALPPSTTSDAKAYYATTATVVLTASDTGSGVSATYYSLDGAPRVAGTVVTTATAGVHTVEYWSVDKAANEEAPHNTARFTIDRTAPRTTSDAKPLYTSSARITLSATDVGSGVLATYYSLDGAAAVKGSVISLAGLGAHTVEYWSVDTLGNSENPRQRATFRIGVAPVKVTLTRTPKASVLTRTRKAGVARFQLSAKLRRPNGTSFRGVKVILQMRERTSAKWESMYTLRSNTSGIVSKSFAKRRRGTAYYRWYVPAAEANLVARTTSQKIIIK